MLISTLLLLLYLIQNYIRAVIAAAVTVATLPTFSMNLIRVIISSKISNSIRVCYLMNHILLVLSDITIHIKR